MNNAIFRYKVQGNEPVELYLDNTPQRQALCKELESITKQQIEIPVIVNGEKIYTGNVVQIRMPHDHSKVIATVHMAGEKEVQMAIDAALSTHRQWESLSWVERASILLKIAELISGKYRHKMNAATMIGQSKTVFQAEIDAVDETVDFIRFNVDYVSSIYENQPYSPPGMVNRIEYRPLEGFVFAISPFNFTSIASNLVLAPVLMGNTVVWKPATNAVFSNYLLMQIYEEAGLPAGVVNFIPGHGHIIGKMVLSHPMLAGVHFTGSTETFNDIFRTIASNIDLYRSYPRIVGETGGKDFVLAHSSANVEELATALIRGAFEYQGQKCSAASRAYIPKSIWDRLLSLMKEKWNLIKIGDPANFENFMSAVIDRKAFDKIVSYIEYARNSSEAEIILGGHYDDSVGYFIEPTVILTSNPRFKTMEEEIFGPVLTMFVYDDDKWEEVLQLVDSTSPYGLTGSIFATDRYELVKACRILKYAAGNLYFNDKPTGAVVGQQPFGGARKSGTNDKAGSMLNLLRWTSPRTIKENLLPPSNFLYPFMKGTCNC